MSSAIRMLMFQSLASHHMQVTGLSILPVLAGTSRPITVGRLVSVFAKPGIV